MKELIVADIKSFNNGGKCIGHYFPIARNYQQMLQSSNNVIIAGGPIYKQGFRMENLLLLPYDVIADGNVVTNKFHTLMNARLLFREAGNKTILLQQSTATTSFVGIWLFARRHTTLYMIQYDLSGLRGKLNRVLFKLAKSKIKGVICPNDDVGHGYGLPYIVVPDYIFVPSKIEKPFIPYFNKEFDFCIVGRLNREKGVIETVNRIADTNHKLLVAGMIEGDENFVDEFKNSCAEKENVELHIGYLSDAEYLNYIRNSRYCILNYHGDYTVRSSGVVFDFIFNGVPVVAHRCQAMNFVEDNGIGCCYEDLSQVDFSKILHERTHERFLKNIEKYKSTHQKYIKDIINFMKL